MIKTRQSACSTRCAGLTLVELLVVLSILAVLSTVALRSVIGTLDQQNYDANVTQLEEIEKAVLGEGATAGFVADLGRLPEVRAGSSPEELLEELWDSTLWGSSELYTVSSPAGDSEVKMGAGWRGPYLDLGINRDDLTDTLGNPFELSQANRDPVDPASDATDDVAIIESFGADGAAGGTVYDEDLEVVFEDTAAGENFWRAPLTVNVSPPEGETLIERDVAATTEHIVVRVYGPDPDNPGTVHTIEQVSEVIPVTGISTFSFRMDGDDDPAANTGPGIPIGPKAIRAYRIETVPSKQADILASGGLKSRSPVAHFDVNRFVTSETLHLD